MDWPETVVILCGYIFIDCKFSPFSIDVKPKHGPPDLAREIAFKKIAARVAGTRLASEKLG